MVSVRINFVCGVLASFTFQELCGVLGLHDDHGLVVDIQERVQPVRDQVGNMVAGKALIRSLKPKETRETVLATAKQTLAVLQSTVEPRLGLMLG